MITYILQDWAYCHILLRPSRQFSVPFMYIPIYSQGHVRIAFELFMIVLVARTVVMLGSPVKQVLDTLQTLSAINSPL